MSELDHRRLGVFLGTLLALAGVFQAVAWLSGIGIGPIAPAYMFTPLLAALAVVARCDCSLREIGVRVGRVRWIGAAALAGVVVVGLSVAISLAVPGVQFDPTELTTGPGSAGGTWTLVAFGTVLVVGVNAVMAFGEGLGWRGYLLWELVPLGFWKASLAIGALWGLWHFPSVVAGVHYVSFPYVGLAMMVAATVALSPLYTYLVWRADSVFAAVFLHGIFNGTAMVANAVTVTEGRVLGQLVARPIGMAGIVACGVLSGLIALRGTPTLDRAGFRASLVESDRPT